MQLDLLRQNLKQYVENKAPNMAKRNQPISEFNVGDKVAVRDNKKSSGGVRWKLVLFCRVWGNICTKLKCHLML